MSKDRLRPAVTFFLRHLAGGGAERVMVNMATELAKRGHRVDFVLARRHGPYLRDISEQVRIVDLGADRLAWSVVPLARYLRRERPTALLSTLLHSNSAAVIAARLALVPTRLVLREANPTRGSRLTIQAATMIYRQADRIIAPSAGLAHHLAKTHGIPIDRIEMIYNPINLNKIQMAAAQPLDETWFRDDQTPVLLTAGRLTTQKDHVTLMKAFSLVRQRRVCRLVILGEGPLREQLESLTASLGLTGDVMFAGFVPNPYAYMARAKVFVLSSLWEGCSNVLIEAIACGTPVVATDCPYSPREILQDGRVGPLVPTGDHHALAQAILHVLQNPPAEPTLRSRAKDFSMDRAVLHYSKVLWD